MKLLVATDGSRGSRAALRFAARMAEGCRGTQIVVVTVGALRRQLLFAHPESPVGLSLWPELEKRERELATRVLAKAKRDVATHGVKIRAGSCSPNSWGLLPKRSRTKPTRRRPISSLSGPRATEALEAGRSEASRRVFSTSPGAPSPSSASPAAKQASVPPRERPAASDQPQLSLPIRSISSHREKSPERTRREASRCGRRSSEASDRRRSVAKPTVTRGCAGTRTRRRRSCCGPPASGGCLERGCGP